LILPKSITWIDRPTLHDWRYQQFQPPLGPQVDHNGGARDRLSQRSEVAGPLPWLATNGDGAWR